MNLLDSISSRFEIKISSAPEADAQALPIAPAADPDAPCRCGCSRWWLPHGQAGWRCESCQPPPSRSLVARWSDCTPRVTSEAWATFCRPWCPCCGGWRGIEREFSDGSIELKCSTCKTDLPEVPDLLTAADPADQQPQ